MAKDTWTKLRRLLSRAVKGISGGRSADVTASAAADTPSRCSLYATAGVALKGRARGDSARPGAVLLQKPGGPPVEPIPVAGSNSPLSSSLVITGQVGMVDSGQPLVLLARRRTGV